MRSHYCRLLDALCPIHQPTTMASVFSSYSLSVLLSTQALTRCTHRSVSFETRLKSAGGAELNNWVSSEKL